MNSGFTWSRNLAGRRFAAAGIGDLCCSRMNADELYVGLIGCQDCRSLVRHSNDGGRSWTRLPAKGLPTRPLHAVALAEEDGASPILAVAGEAGVWRSDDGGRTFTEASNGLPNVRVTDLVRHRRSGSWTAATYGRGLW